MLVELLRRERYKGGKKQQESDCKRSEAIAAYSETGSGSMLANQVTRGSNASTAVRLALKQHSTK